LYFIIVFFLIIKNLLFFVLFSGVQPTPGFVDRTFRHPQSQLDKIKHVCRDFWWWSFTTLQPTLDADKDITTLVSWSGPAMEDHIHLYAVAKRMKAVDKDKPGIRFLVCKFFFVNVDSEGMRLICVLMQRQSNCVCVFNCVLKSEGVLF
jgi:hypothetical protein